MANPLYNQFGNNPPVNPMSQLMSDFKRLQQTIQNPQKEVENLLQTGRMSQNQFNQLAQMANQLMGRK